MKKVVIGYLYSGRRLGLDEIYFRRVAKKKNVIPVLISTSNWSSEEDLKKKINSCDIIYNSSGDDFVIETEKTVEEMGKKMIETSKSFYYTEDKWMFFLKCQEHGVPTPKTILLSEDIAVAKKELHNFGEWPVILKRVSGTCGEYVEKAKNLKEAERLIKKFWKKGSEKLPIIAQECILSPSYRVLVIDNKIVQTAMKKNKTWKATGIYATRFGKFPIDNELRNIIKKMMKFVDIRICGIDFLKKNGKWVALEVNAAPGFDFFGGEREILAEKLVNFLKKAARKN